MGDVNNIIPYSSARRRESKFASAVTEACFSPKR